MQSVALKRKLSEAAFRATSRPVFSQSNVYKPPIVRDDSIRKAKRSGLSARPAVRWVEHVRSGQSARRKKRTKGSTKIKYNLRKRKEKKTGRREETRTSSPRRRTGLRNRALLSERRADNQSRPLNPVRTPPPPPRLIALISGTASAASTGSAVGGREERVFQLWGAFLSGAPGAVSAVRRRLQLLRTAHTVHARCSLLRPRQCDADNAARARAPREYIHLGRVQQSLLRFLETRPGGGLRESVWLAKRRRPVVQKGKRKKRGRLFRYVLLCCFRETSQSLRRFLHSLPLRTRVEIVEGLAGTCASWAGLRMGRKKASGASYSSSANISVCTDGENLWEIACG